MLLAPELQKRLDDAWHKIQQSILGTYSKDFTPSQFDLDEESVSSIEGLAKKLAEELAKDKQEKELIAIYERITADPDFDEDELMASAYNWLSEVIAQRNSDNAVNPSFYDIVGDMIEHLGFDQVKTFLETE